MRIEPGYVEIVSAVLRELGHDPALFPLPRPGAITEDELKWKKLLSY